MLQEGEIKKKEVETMKEIVKYEAFDGMIFEDECECYEYERMKEIGEYAGQTHFFDWRKRPLSIGCAPDEIYYVIVETIEAAMWWDNTCFKEGIIQPFKQRAYKPGFYWYEDYDDGWKCLEEEMEKLQMMADEFQQFIE